MSSQVKEIIYLNNQNYIA